MQRVGMRKREGHEGGVEGVYAFRRIQFSQLSRTHIHPPFILKIALANWLQKVTSK